MYSKENILCQQCICPACPLFFTNDCLEGIDHCVTRCVEAGRVEKCWWILEEENE